MNIFNESHSQRGSDRILWQLKKQHKLILISILSLLSLSFLLACKEYLKMQNSLKLLNKRDLVNVLAVNKDLKFGDLIKESDLESIPYPRELFLNLESEKNDRSSGLIPCHVELNSQENMKISYSKDILNKALNIPLKAGSLLRKEYIDEKHNNFLLELTPVGFNLLELNIEDSGANKYLKVGDLISLYANTGKEFTEKITDEAKIVLLEKINTGEGHTAKVNLTLAIHRSQFETALAAKVANKLFIAIKNYGSGNFSKPNISQTSHQSKNLIQRSKLTISDGHQERIYR